MKFTAIDPPRRFAVGDGSIVLEDCGRVELEPDQQVTFLTETGREYDVARKSWGYYATPSLDGRLESFGLRGVFVRGSGAGRYFLLLVEAGKEEDFHAYLERTGMKILCWLDSAQACERIERLIDGTDHAGEDA